MFRSHILKAAVTGVAAILALSACGGSPSSSPAETIKVGALAVPAGDMLKHVQRELAAKEGLTVDYKEFFRLFVLAIHAELDAGRTS